MMRGRVLLWRLLARLGLCLPGKIMYIGGSDTLPPPLDREEEADALLRLERGEDLQCTALPGLYPCGEGAGYAGGIVSAAVDGLRVAAAIIAEYAE